MFRFSAMIALLVFSSNTFAYLDPGTGSMILQGIIAGLALAAATVKHYWHQLVALFHRRPTENDPEQPASGENQDN